MKMFLILEASQPSGANYRLEWGVDYVPRLAFDGISASAVVLNKGVPATGRSFSFRRMWELGCLSTYSKTTLFPYQL